ncbi:unnamed protein product [Closterium sp. NIES-65]|nr:unnamed protein product [Closterium sp. NIES-65]
MAKSRRTTRLPPLLRPLRPLRLLLVLAIAVLCVGVVRVSGLYEDQVGTYDWVQPRIGGVRFAAFLTSSQRKRVLVGTDRNVIAALNLRTGDVAWRRVLGDKDTLHALDMGGRYLVTVSGTEAAAVRAWAVPDGTLAWETMLPLPAAAAAGDVMAKFVTIPAADGSSADRVVVLLGSAAAAAAAATEVHCVSAATGEVLWSATLPSHAHSISLLPQGSILLTSLSPSLAFSLTTLDAASGKVTASAASPTSSSSSSASFSGHSAAYVTATGTAVAVDSASGNILTAALVTSVTADATADATAATVQVHSTPLASLLPKEHHQSGVSAAVVPEKAPGSFFWLAVPGAVFLLSARAADGQAGSAGQVSLVDSFPGLSAVSASVMGGAAGAAGAGGAGGEGGEGGSFYSGLVGSQGSGDTLKFHMQECEGLMGSQGNGDSLQFHVHVRHVEPNRAVSLLSFSLPIPSSLQVLPAASSAPSALLSDSVSVPPHRAPPVHHLLSFSLPIPSSVQVHQLLPSSSSPPALLSDSVSVPLHRAPPVRVFLNAYARAAGAGGRGRGKDEKVAGEGKAGAFGFRLLVVGEDDSLSLLQQGDVVWEREEALASVVAVTVAELPEEEELSVAAVEHDMTSTTSVVAVTVAELPEEEEELSVAAVEHDMTRVGTSSCIPHLTFPTLPPSTPSTSFQLFPRFLQGEVVWEREEALASVVAVTVAELPEEEEELSVAAVEHDIYEWARTHLLRAKSSEVVWEREEALASVVAVTIAELPEEEEELSVATVEHDIYEWVRTHLLRAKGEVVWEREEALASVVAVAVAELPEEEEELSVAAVEHDIYEWARTHLLRAKVSLNLGSAEEQALVHRLRTASPEKIKPFRDRNGFRRILLLLTAPGGGNGGAGGGNGGAGGGNGGAGGGSGGSGGNSGRGMGKLFALHSGDGRVLWAAALPSGGSSGGRGASVFSPEALVLWRDPHRTSPDQTPEALVLQIRQQKQQAEDEKVAHAALVTIVNGHTGDVLESKGLPFVPRLVSPLPLVGKDERRLVMLVEKVQLNEAEEQEAEGVGKEGKEETDGNEKGGAAAGGAGGKARRYGPVRVHVFPGTEEARGLFEGHKKEVFFYLVDTVTGAVEGYSIGEEVKEEGGSSGSEGRSDGGRLGGGVVYGAVLVWRVVLPADSEIISAIAAPKREEPLLLLRERRCVGVWRVVLPADSEVISAIAAPKREEVNVCVQTEGKGIGGLCASGVCVQGAMGVHACGLSLPSLRPINSISHPPQSPSNPSQSQHTQSQHTQVRALGDRSVQFKLLSKTLLIMPLTLRALGDRSVQFKLLSKNLLFLATVTPPAAAAASASASAGAAGAGGEEGGAVVVYLVDTVGGQVVERVVHSGMQGPVHAVSVRERFGACLNMGGAGVATGAGGVVVGGEEGGAVMVYLVDTVGGQVVERVVKRGHAGTRARGAAGAGGEEGGLAVVYLVDTVGGQVVERVVHAGMQGPVHAVMAENWVVYHYFNPAASCFASLVNPYFLVSVLLSILAPCFPGQVMAENWVVYHYFNPAASRHEVSTIELLDTSLKDVPVIDYLKYGLSIPGSSNLTAPLSAAEIPWERVKRLRQSYYFPYALRCISVTSTLAGITNKHVLFGTALDQVLALDRRFLDPRRVPEPSQQDKEAGIMPYSDSLPAPGQAYLTHRYRIEGLKHILSFPTRLESTTLVLAHGLDLFFVRTAPSRVFDSLGEDFSFALLLGTIAVLSIAIVVTWGLSRKQELKQRWK